MTDKTPRGRFVWHELVTPDTAAGHKYYNSVFHWKTAHGDQHPDYTMFATGGERIGGATVLTEGAPRWLHYIGTNDLDATIEQAVGLGATVVTGPTDVSDSSRYAVLTDPQGAAFALYSDSKPYGDDRTPRRGEFSWMELAATNANEALHFYCALFGWERTAAHDMGPLGVYYLFANNGREIGGAFDKPAEMPGPPAWLGYVRGKDLDTVVSKAKAGGGMLINGPMEVPGGDWIAQFIDPQGAMFAVHVVKADVDAAKAAKAGAPAEPTPPAAVKASKVRKKATNKSTPAAKKSTPVRKKSTAPKKKAARTRKRTAKAKSVKRSAGKAGRVRSRSQKVHKARAASRKKSGVKKKAARPKKGK